MELKAEQRTQASTLGQDWNSSFTFFNPSAKCFCQSLQLRATWLQLSTWCCPTALTWPDPKCWRTSADKETSGCHSWIHQAPVHPKAVCAMKWHHVLSSIELGQGPTDTDCYQQGIYELIIMFPFLQQGSNLCLQHLHFFTQHLVPGFGGITFFLQFLVVFLESVVLSHEFLQRCKRKWKL